MPQGPEGIAREQIDRMLGTSGMGRAEVASGVNTMTKDLTMAGSVALLLLIMLGAMLPGAPGAAPGDVYTWENPDGTLGVADDASKVPEQHRGRAKKVGEGAQGEGGTGGVYYSRPQEQMPEEPAPPPPRRRSARLAPVLKEEPFITMEEKKKAEDKAAEQRKKDEEEIKRSWEGMKKALAGH